MPERPENIALEPLTMNGIKPAELTILGDFVTEDMESLQMFLDGIRTEVENYLEEE